MTETLGSFLGLFIVISVWFGCKLVFSEDFKEKVSKIWGELLFFPIVGVVLYLFFGMFDFRVTATVVG